MPPNRRLLAALEPRDSLYYRANVTSEKDLIRIRGLAMVVRTGKDPVFVPAIRRVLASETKHIQNGSSQGQRVASALGILQLALHEGKFGSKDAVVPTDISPLQRD